LSLRPPFTSKAPINNSIKLLVIAPSTSQRKSNTIRAVSQLFN
jgi:hypothetical protein